MEYPKIETLFNRDPKTFKVVEGEFRCPEFEMVDRWYVTEKIDGTNIRIIYQPVYETTGFISLTQIQEFRRMELLFKGRTDKAELHPNLTKHLERTFIIQKLAEIFPETEEFPMHPTVTLFGEGYGPKIQKGGNYRKDISFRLFDVFIKDQNNTLGGWWLEPENIQDIADKLGIITVPTIATNYPTDDIVKLVKSNWLISKVAQDEGGNEHYKAEGIVARTNPMLFTRQGKRLIWKLKRKDFPHNSTTSN